MFSGDAKRVRSTMYGTVYAEEAVGLVGAGEGSFLGETDTNTADGDYSVVVGGLDNTANAIYSSASGYKASAEAYGERAFSGGTYAGLGDGTAQVSEYLLRQVWIGDTGTKNLYLDHPADTLEIPYAENEVCYVEISVVCTSSKTAGMKSAGQFTRYLVDSHSGTVPKQRITFFDDFNSSYNISHAQTFSILSAQEGSSGLLANDDNVLRIRNHIAQATDNPHRLVAYVRVLRLRHL